LRPEERLEEVQKLIAELIRLSSELPIIVEGRKDERALRELGVEGIIIRLNVGDSVFKTCEGLSRTYRKVILLTDWDRRGGHLAKLMREGLEANGVQYDDGIRAKLAILTKKDIKDVESLSRHLARLKNMSKSGVGGFK